MTYPEAIRYLESFINYEKVPAWPYKESLKLERFRDFLLTINNPQDALRCIHVAGSKGKGSTCAFIAYILRAAGFKAGLYTSPHLSDFRERIRILREKNRTSAFEGMISRAELARIVGGLSPSIETFNRKSRHGPLSFFEVYTALAYVYFKEKKVDFVVLETGLGGRLDATNVVDSLVAVITPISYEHTQKLGSTLREIAGEKAGIIKGPRLIVISAPQDNEAIKVIRKRCNDAGAKLFEVGRDISYTKRGGRVTVKGLLRRYVNLKIRLIGEHQWVNAASALGAVEALRYYNVEVGIDSIRQGLYNAVWPGRCEVVSREPLVILDGAQNAASSRTLKNTIVANFRYKKLILVLGISNDKDIKGVCAILKDLADKIILTQADNPRATSPEELAGHFIGKDIFITGSVHEARIKVARIAAKEDLVLVTGSLFVVGEFRHDKTRH